MYQCVCRSSSPPISDPRACRRCLDALARQDSAPDEIIVVARREDEASRRYIREREASRSASCRSTCLPDARASWRH